MAGFSKNSRVEIKLDAEKLAEFVRQCERVTAELDAAAARAGEVIKQLKEAGDTASKKVGDAAKDLNRAAEKARSIRPPGGRTW